MNKQNKINSMSSVGGTTVMMIQGMSDGQLLAMLSMAHMTYLVTLRHTQA